VKLIGLQNIIKNHEYYNTNENSKINKAQVKAFTYRIEELEQQVLPLREEADTLKNQLYTMTNVNKTLREEFKKCVQELHHKERLPNQAEWKLHKISLSPPEWLPPSWIANLIERLNNPKLDNNTMRRTNDHLRTCLKCKTSILTTNNSNSTSYICPTCVKTSTSELINAMNDIPEISYTYWREDSNPDIDITSKTSFFNDTPNKLRMHQNLSESNIKTIQDDQNISELNAGLNLKLKMKQRPYSANLTTKSNKRINTSNANSATTFTSYSSTVPMVSNFTNVNNNNTNTTNNKSNTNNEISNSKNIISENSAKVIKWIKGKKNNENAVAIDSNKNSNNFTPVKNPMASNTQQIKANTPTNSTYYNPIFGVSKKGK
jgi:hypothetical protein